MKTVDIIASGYDWICPSCDFDNHEIEILEFFECHNAECNDRFEIGDIGDAYG